MMKLYKVAFVICLFILATCGVCSANYYDEHPQEFSLLGSSLGKTTYVANDSIKAMTVEPGLEMVNCLEYVISPDERLGYSKSYVFDGKENKVWDITSGVAWVVGDKELDFQVVLNQSAYKNTTKELVPGEKDYVYAMKLYKMGFGKDWHK